LKKSQSRKQVRWPSVTGVNGNGSTPDQETILVVLTAGQLLSFVRAKIKPSRLRRVLLFEPEDTQPEPISDPRRPTILQPPPPLGDD
jgi:hypothetical protein